MVNLYPAMGDVNFGKTTVLPEEGLLVVGALVVAVGFFVVIVIGTVVATGVLVVAEPEPEP